MVRGDGHSEACVIEEHSLVSLRLLVGHSGVGGVDEVEGFEEVFAEMLEQAIGLPLRNWRAGWHYIGLSETVHFPQATLGNVGDVRMDAHDIGKRRTRLEGDGELGFVVVAEGKLAGGVARLWLLLCESSSNKGTGKEEEESHYL